MTEIDDDKCLNKDSGSGSMWGDYWFQFMVTVDWDEGGD